LQYDRLDTFAHFTYYKQQYIKQLRKDRLGLRIIPEYQKDHDGNVEGLVNGGGNERQHWVEDG